jgi:hypothetical protein
MIEVDESKCEGGKGESNTQYREWGRKFKILRWVMRPLYTKNKQLY